MKKLYVVALVCLLLIGFGGGTLTGIYIQRHDAQTLNVSPDSVSEFNLVEQAWNITRNNYVDRTASQPQSLAYGAIAGMIDALGDTGHSTFLTPEQVKLEANFEQGHYEGIGAEVQEKNGNVVIVAPLDGSPAQKAGLMSGDIILKVNGQTVTDVSTAVNLILGPAGTTVTLTIQSAAGVMRDVTLARATINVVEVTWNRLPGTTVAQLRISSFSQGVSANLDKALAAISADRDTAIILDLRDNPGGLLNEAIGVASRFLKSGDVLLEKDINGKITHDPVVKVTTVNELPMAVLVNQGTASAAEIVSGALRDAGRAKLVGETTFGTGTVLVPFPLADGSEVVLAIQEWLTPSGKTIWHTGLAPDVVVPLAVGVAPLFPDLEAGLTNQTLLASGDQQLLTALSLLTTGK